MQLKDLTNNVDYENLLVLHDTTKVPDFEEANFAVTSFSVINSSFLTLLENEEYNQVVYDDVKYKINEITITNSDSEEQVLGIQSLIVSHNKNYLFCNITCSNLDLTNMDDEDLKHRILIGIFVYDIKNEQVCSKEEAMDVISSLEAICKMSDDLKQ